MKVRERVAEIVDERRKAKELGFSDADIEDRAREIQARQEKERGSARRHR